MENDKPYKWIEQTHITCSTTRDYVDLDYQPDRIILSNMSTNREIYVSFDQAAKDSRGLIVHSERVQKIDIRARRISAIADAGTPVLAIIALAHKRKKW